MDEESYSQSVSSAIYGKKMYSTLIHSIWACFALKQVTDDGVFSYVSYSVLTDGSCEGALAVSGTSAANVRCI